MALTTASLVDGIFVGNYVGTVRAGKYFGEKNTTAASAIFNKFLISVFAFSITTALLSVFIEKSIFDALAAPQTLYTSMQEYFTIIRWTLIVQLVGMVLYYFIRLDGHPILATMVSGLLFFHDSIIGFFLDQNDNKVGTLANQLAFVIWPLFIVNGANIILSCYLTAIHKPLPSTIIAMSRSLILPGGLLILLYWLLPQLSSFNSANDGNNFLIALPIAEWCTFILAIVLCMHFRPSKLVVKIDDVRF